MEVSYEHRMEALILPRWHRRLTRLSAAGFLLAAAGSISLHAQRYGTLPVPPANPLTSEKIILGKKLFSDPRLSGDGSLTCASCHDPAHAFADHRAVSTGILGRTGDRNVPTLLGRGYGALQFWDGRAASLEGQVTQPISNPLEMGAAMDTVLSRLHADPAYTGLTAESLAEALASYVRTIRSVDAGFDRYMSGLPNGLSDLDRTPTRPTPASPPNRWPRLWRAMCGPSDRLMRASTAICPACPTAFPISRARDCACLRTRPAATFAMAAISSPTRRSTIPASPGKRAHCGTKAAPGSPARSITKAPSRRRRFARSRTQRRTCTTAASRPSRK